MKKIIDKYRELRKSYAQRLGINERAIDAMVIITSITLVVVII